MRRYVKTIVPSLVILVIIAALTATLAVVAAADKSAPAAAPAAASPEPAKPDAAKPDAGKVTPYPLTTCLVSGEKLGGPDEPPVTLVDKGQEFKFCCKKCVKKFKEDPAKYHALLQQEIEKAKGSKG
jgi:hypothetical protein